MGRFSIMLPIIGLGLMATPSLAGIISSDTTINGVTLDFGAEPPLAEMVKNNSAPNGTTLTLATQPSNIPINYTAPTTLEASGQGNGFAFVSGLGNGANESGFSSLTISPQSTALGFNAINFNIAALGTGNNTWYGDIILDPANDDPLIKFENVAFNTGGENKFAIFSDSNTLFSSITFSGLATAADGGVAQNFDSIRQVSIGVAAVPEASTWAMMIVGFGFVGGQVRARRRTGSLPKLASA